MGLFSFFKKKDKVENDEFNLSYGRMTLEEALNRSRKNVKNTEEGNDKDILAVVRESSELMKDMQKRLEEAKLEYESVTNYLTDIQKLDALSLDAKAEIDDAARKIINLSKEREKYQNKDSDINSPQYHYIKKYEDIIPDEIKKMEENEAYQLLVMNDLKHLEGERGTIIYEKENAVEKREFIKKFSMAISLVVLCMFILLFLLTDKVEADLNIPFFLAGVMALVAAAYIVTVLRNSAITYKTADIKLNKLIQLVNKIKIKYVNVVGILEFMYDKHHVNSSKELKFLWERYMAAKDEAKRYRHNTELLEVYHGILIEELSNKGINDAEVWLYQPEALLDDKEMVEVRHRLNVRRKKLRERIDNNSRQIEKCLAELAGYRKKYPEYDEVIAGIIR